MLDKKNEEKVKQDDLWTRIKARAEKEKTSYYEAAEKCISEYWQDYGLTKEP